MQTVSVLWGVRVAPLRTMEPMLANAPSPHVLLCEQCGYEIHGLAHASNCPECGLAIAESLPTSRPGSPWQHDERVGAALRTTWWVLTNPVESFDRIRIDAQSSARLRETLVLFSAVLISTAVCIQILRTIMWRSWLQSIIAVSLLVLILILLIPLLGLFLRVLCWIEYRGIRLFGRLHGWRIDHDVATSVIAHASAGWLLGGVLVLLGSVFPIHVELGAFFLGLLAFETLVYVGVRRCKFANVCRADTRPLSSSHAYD